MLYCVSQSLAKDKHSTSFIMKKIIVKALNENDFKIESFYGSF